MCLVEHYNWRVVAMWKEIGKTVRVAIGCWASTLRLAFLMMAIAIILKMASS